MFLTDPISDLIVRIKNANQRKHKTVEIPHSNKKEAIVKLIKEEGYISSYSVEGSKKTDKRLLVTLKYKGKQSAIVGIKRVSKPGLRVYVKSEEIPKVLSGYGTCIMSTSKGLMTDKEARKANVGGEIIAFIW
ncbi:30S ribosomal protein S8 [Mycoplasmopsis synoviae]|uniref:Small ribosomal subunit protein uS8 n=2 Tax=Mycoplasmopsis synoviae TaxID=2109 RepID=RS8_MYCS5|nr:30S ribosomal protein S8 [Mycoplasmopsis synoviae]Q4A5D5.2 RecName: Full=Small ribosomal subunit protein uS8; AltName: Full=30S ribosomal protein S8 [Mycoplasmopsis synoviae 53]AAZ44036.2 30S ribosomal protein S8 [Mycoplasmopsis synoviae 53]AKB11346.1 30S ribosomal protein S8 [Mycoplasmopsis synoviae ATCC 25204]AKJ20852.1 SSU ribosomal protein S8p (S15Ae) [Mycoplasmopsis synoviae]AQU48177.1 SSU ribosomal protein S8p (S15Ae) [Mycoplasmopsis synoviae]AWL84392.1 30S ribosomal protein S8 [Myco